MKSHSSLRTAALLTLFMLVAAGVSMLALSVSANAFRWIGLSWMSAFAAAAFVCQDRPRVVLINLAGVAGVLFLLELYCGGGLAPLGLAPNDWVLREYTRHAWVLDESLGYAPEKNTRIAAKKIFRGEVVYDAIYSIDENGFRRTPPRPAGSPAVMFLGDSFTFGHGLNDDETFPAVFQSASGCKAINLAYDGYGPHQMLRILETGQELPEASPYRPYQAFYLSLPDHADRAAGAVFWDPSGPRYEIDADGTLRYRGPWRGRVASKAISTFFRSSIMGLWWLNRWRLDTVTPAEKERNDERFSAIVASSMRIFKKRYRGDFRVLFWRAPRPRIKELLRLRGVPYVVLPDAIPSIQRQESYFRYDGHPKAALSREVGLYLAAWVAARLKKEVRKTASATSGPL